MSGVPSSTRSSQKKYIERRGRHDQRTRRRRFGAAADDSERKAVRGVGSVGRVAAAGFTHVVKAVGRVTGLDTLPAPDRRPRRAIRGLAPVSKQHPRRAPQPARPRSAPQPQRPKAEPSMRSVLVAKKRRTVSGVPVAHFTSRGGMRPHFRMSMRGADIIVHGCDRMDPATFDTKITSVADLNYSGSVVARIPIEPLSIGERLRRLSSCFEVFSFETVSIHFESALPSIAVGSVLGFFDQDPTDTFDAGVLSLKEAAAHPGAHSTKVWESSTWVMPRRVGGRYYVGDAGDTSADKRLQEQGTFRLMIDVPLDNNSVPDDVTYYLGSIYMTYTIKLSKPTIQPNFHGTSDLISWPLAATTQPIINGAFIESIRALDVYPFFDPRSNGGSEFSVVSGSPANIAVPAGVWDITFVLRYSSGSDPTNYVLVWSLIASDTSTSAQTAGAFNDGSPASSFTKPDADGLLASYRVFDTGSGTSGRTLNFGSRLLVPAGTYKYVTPYLHKAGATIDVRLLSMQMSISLALPTQTELNLVAPSARSASVRLDAIERTLALESKDPVLCVDEPDSPRSESRPESKSSELKSPQVELGKSDPGPSSLAKRAALKR